ncbi:MAG: hypothetical protein NT079_02630, partial [Candidatus Omnitrophica bacterium]|nr:hypothetical protein [Candidatus Omnitrophota bacterium]
MNRIYLEYGYYATENIPLEFEGIKGKSEKDIVMKSKIPALVKLVNEGEETVIIKERRIRGAKTGSESLKTGGFEFAESGYRFVLNDTDYITTRPSGTEPYIRFYGQLRIPQEGLSWENIEVEKQKADARIKEIVLEAQQVVLKVVVVA